MAPNNPSKPTSHFPAHSSPRTWLLTSAACPIGIALARAVLTHGDNVILGVKAEDLGQYSWKGIGKAAVNGSLKGTSGIGSRRAEHLSERVEEFEKLLGEVMEEEGWEERLKVAGLDGRCESLLSSLRRYGRFCRSDLVYDKGLGGGRWDD